MPMRWRSRMSPSTSRPARSSASLVRTAPARQPCLRPSLAFFLRRRVTFNGSEGRCRRREAMFYLPDGVRPYQDQPVTRVLAFFADVYRRSTNEVEDAVESVGLTPVLHKRVQSLSKGYGRRLILALGLLTPHPLLLMDEPFDGFDLRQTREIVGVLRKEVAKGRTFALAIHQLLDAERVCDRFILLADGRVRGVGTLNDLRVRTGITDGSLEDIFLALT